MSFTTSSNFVIPNRDPRTSLWPIGYGWYMACWPGYRVSRSLIPGNFTIDGNFFKFPFLKLFSIFSIFQFWFKIFESNFFQNSWLLKISGWKFQNTDDDLGWPLWCNSLLYWIPIPKDHYPHGKQSLSSKETDQVTSDRRQKH